MKMRADYNHATGRWEITDTDAIPPSTFAEVSDEARAKLLANAANNFAPMLAALEALLAANTLIDDAYYAAIDKAEEKARAAIKAAKEGA